MKMPISALIGLVLTGAFLFCADLRPMDRALSARCRDRRCLGGTVGAALAGHRHDRPRYPKPDDPWRADHDLSWRWRHRCLSFGLGSFLGFMAAVSGGWVDQGLSRLVDLMMAIPSLIVALVVLSVLPINLTVLILIMGLLDSTRVFRLSRAVAMDITVMDYVEAAKLRGEGQGWIIFREILPNALSPLVAEFGLRFIFAVLFISTLSFLGLGIQPPLADWGGMVKENKDGLIYGKSAALMPALAIALLAISVNLVADWILSRTTSLKGGRGG